MSEVDIPESELAKRLGISRDSVAGHRKRSLTRGEDWSKAGRVIVYTKIGAERLIKLVGVVIPPDEKKSPVAATNGHSEETLTFIRGGFLNRRIIQAKRMSGELVMVRVRSSINFTSNDHRGEPMTFPARRDGGVWVLTRPLPRWRGKW
jgi:hypothetical protein